METQITKETPEKKKTFLCIFILKYNMSKKLTNDVFIKKAKMIHGNKYDYSKVDYKNNHTKITISCDKHGDFEQLPNDHISKKCGCFKCSGKGQTTDDFIKKSRLVHGDRYDYSKTIYKGMDYNLIIICKKHGEFKQCAYTHLIGCGCSKCNKQNLWLKSNTDNFIKKAKIVHQDKYDYSKVQYDFANKKIKIICEKHGCFYQTPTSHLTGRGCPVCKESKGEIKVRNFLISNDLKFEPQKRFKECKRIRPLPFDFYLPEKNICIEFDGKQHFTNKAGWFGSKKTEEEFLKIKESEKIKLNFCKKNKIKLIRISYKEIDNINKKLKKITNDNIDNK